jgi:ribose transport system permease protein
MSSEAATVPAAAAATQRRRRLFEIRDIGIVLAFVALFVGLSIATDTFLTQRNLLNILDQSAPLGIIACAVTIAIVAGIFDVSSGAMFGVAAVVATKAANGISPTAGLILGVLAGLALGIANGVIVHYTRINSFIGTLATSIVYRGGAILITGGAIVTVTDPSFAKVGTGELLQAKWSVWVFGAFFLLTAFILARTTFGRYVYAVGGNEEAARLSGVRVGLVRGGCFALVGLAAGIAGVLAASRTSSAQANLGTGLELSAIAAAVVGGTSILGGEGAVWRGVLGVLTLAIIGNGFDLLSIETTYQQLVQGVLILLAVAVDQLVRRR